jgi:hypothetical protein
MLTVAEVHGVDSPQGLQTATTPKACFGVGRFVTLRGIEPRFRP